MSKGKPTVKAFKAPSPSPCSARSLFPFGGRGMKTCTQARTQATTWAPVHSPSSRQCPWVQARCLPKVPSSCINREDTSQAGLQLKPRRATGPKSRLPWQNKTLTVPTQCQGKASLPSPWLPGTQRPDPRLVLPCRGSQPSAALGCCLFPSTARALRSMSSLLQPWDVPLGSASLGWPPRPGLVPLGWVASSSRIPWAHTCPCWSHSHALHSHAAGCSNSGHQLIALLLFLAWRRVFAGR